MNVTIQIKLYATLQKRLPEGATDRFEIEAGISVETLLAELGIPATDAKLVFVNGKKASLSTPLDGGERVGIFPPVGGG